MENAKELLLSYIEQTEKIIIEFNFEKRLILIHIHICGLLL